MKAFPKSLSAKLLAELGVQDPDAVFLIQIEPGHVTVKGYERDQFETFTGHGPTPAVWTSVWPVDFDA